MKNIVYVMQVDWNWIKQRPHFLAEELAKNNRLTVMYQHRYRRKGYQKRGSQGLKLKPIYVIPRGDRYGILRKVNYKLKNAAIRYQTKRNKADALYLTFPDQVDAISKNYTGTVVYDCMDNHPAFVKDPEARKTVEQQEARLLEKADIVLVSSLKLEEELMNRYGKNYKEKIHLVRNGYNAQDRKSQNVDKKDNKRYTVAYFGTISSWFNFAFLEESLKIFPDLQYRLMGPLADGVQIPAHERISYCGTVEHSALGKAVADADCLMMPFVVNEIIESVDPVKLYEYINFNKNILCVQYPEVQRFEPFVYFYTDYKSFIEKLRELAGTQTIKYTDLQRRTFLQDNSWTRRAETIEQLLENKRKGR